MDTKTRIRLFIISLILGLSFLTLSIIVEKDVFRSFDYEVMVKLQSSINPVFDLPLSLITPLGSSEIITLTILSIFIILLIKKRHLFLGIFFYFVIFIIELAGKMLIFHPKPPDFLNRYALDLHMPSSFFIRTDFSYPSGHMARTSFIIVILLYLLTQQSLSRNKKIIIGTFFVFILLSIFVSRIYLGEHWLSDVVGGLILGATIGTFALSFW